jgi:cytochrome c
VLGPSFKEVAERYTSSPAVISTLANKIISGGAGVWGNTHYMTAHPQLSKEQASTIVKYILSLIQQKSVDSLPATGSVMLQPLNSKQAGTYVLSATYTDMGNGVVPLTGKQQLVLRPPFIEGEDADIVSRINRGTNELGSIHNKSYFVLKAIDLKGISQVTYNYSSNNIGATLEVHIDSAKGAIISTLNYAATGDWNKYKQVTTAIQDPGGKHDLYFVFRKDTEPNHDMFALDWLRFGK